MTVTDKADKRASKESSGESRNIHTKIARDLGVAIVSGKFAPGDTVYGEVEYATQFGVSRSAYREALRMLAAKGLVESRPKTGTRVLAKARWNLLDPDVLAWSFVHDPSEDFLRDLFELRTIIEPAACEMAARRRTPSDVSLMGHALEEMARHGLSTAAGQEADKAFHNAILAATRNATLISLGSSIAAAVRWTTVYKMSKRKLPRDPLPEHRAVYEAIVAGDAERAGAAMRTLVELAYHDTELSRRA